MAIIDNLVSYWKLDEASGNATDTVGSNTLTNVGSIARATGKINNGADFESTGADQWFTISHAAQSGLSITGDLTIQAWIKPESLPTTNEAMVIIEKGLGSGNTENYSLRLSNSADTQRIQFFTYSDLVDFHGVTYTTTLSTGTWYHLVGRRDATTWKLYVNAVEAATSTDSQAPVASDAAFFIGARSGDVQHLDGVVDEIGIWSAAKTTGDITSLYNGGAGLAHPFTVSASNTTNFFF